MGAVAGHDAEKANAYVAAARSTTIPHGIELLRRARAIDPDSFDAAFWLGTFLRLNGDFSGSAEAAQAAVELCPEDAAAHASLAATLGLLLRRDEAVANLRRAIVLDPDCATYRHNLGVQLEAAGRDDQAGDCYRESIALDPLAVHSYVSLARLLRERRQTAEAEACLQSAVVAATDSAEGAFLLARSLFDEGFAEEAASCLRESDEPSAEAAALHGRVLLQLGRFHEATPHLLKAIELEPGHVQAHLDLSACRKASPTDHNIVDQMSRLARQIERTELDRRNLHYALGKMHDDLGEYGSAIEHFDEANAMMLAELAGRTLDRADHRAGFDRMMSLFTKEFLSQRRGLGVPSEMPILIVGMIRSGTTLVEQILSSHPDVAAGGELTFLRQRYSRVMAPPPPSTLRDEAAKFASDYLDLLRSIGQEKPRVTDKMPHNFFLLGLVHAIFPNARLIHCRRNPVDTCLSIYTTPYPRPLDFAHDKDSIVFFYKEYQRLMQHWRAVLPTDRFLEVDYEDVVADRMSATRKMVEFCGLEWNDACLHHELNSGAIRTPSWWQARQPVYQTSVARWRRYEPWLGAFRELL